MAGVIGLVTGGVPYVINTLRVIAHENPAGASDFAAHGPQAMGLSLEWAMLSSAMGIVLGILLLWAGIAYLRGYAWADLIGWVYVLVGLAVNCTDMLIFTFKARPSAIRSWLLLIDGVAFVIPMVVAVWLLRRRRRRLRCLLE